MTNVLIKDNCLFYKHVAFIVCPTGRYCREDRCQSFFKFDLIPSMRAPLEECEAAGAVLSLGGKSSLIDAPAENLSESEFINKVQKLNADLFVFIITFGSLEQDLSFIKKLRTYLPDKTFCLRGTPCYVQSENILRNNPQVDFCITGEYETVFTQILTKDYKNSAGIIYLENNNLITNPVPELVKDLDYLPLPDRSIINNNLYKVRGIGRTQATIRVQRGCPYTCTYCLVHTVSGNVARHRSPESIVKEMKELINNNINHFYLRADTFSLNKTWVLETCEKIAKECPSARWVTTTRIERVDEEIISAMKKAGCYGISFGVDVGSESIAKKVLKKADFSKADQAMRLCDKFGIISLAYIMIGFIWDTKETVQEACQFIHKIKPDLVTVHFAHPYQGTVYYDQVKEIGNVKLVNGNQAQASPAIETEQLSDLELQKFGRMILLKHYCRFSVIIKVVRKILVLI